MTCELVTPFRAAAVAARSTGLIIVVTDVLGVVLKESDSNELFEYSCPFAALFACSCPKAEKTGY
jgi:hypothetical protein